MLDSIKEIILKIKAKSTNCTSREVLQNFGTMKIFGAKLQV
jgi:hypothetical protein